MWLAAVELSKFVRNSGSLIVEEIARGHIELQQVKVSTDSESIGNTLREMARSVTSDRYHLVKELEAGQLIESTVSATSKVAGKMVRDSEWPKGCVRVALLHDIRAAVPAADDVIEGGDNLYAVVSPKALKEFVKLVS